MVFRLSSMWIICSIFIINNGKPNKDNDNSDICDSSFLVQRIS